MIFSENSETPNGGDKRYIASLGKFPKYSTEFEVVQELKVKYKRVDGTENTVVIPSFFASDNKDIISIAESLEEY